MIKRKNKEALTWTSTVCKLCKNEFIITSDNKKTITKFDFYCIDCKSKIMQNQLQEIKKLKDKNKKLIGMLIKNSNLFLDLAGSSDNLIGPILEKAKCFDAYVNNENLIDELESEQLDLKRNNE